MICHLTSYGLTSYGLQVLVIGKISNAVVLAGAAYQDEAGYARMTGLPREKTRLLDDKGKTDTQVCPQDPCCHIRCHSSVWQRKA